MTTTTIPSDMAKHRERGMALTGLRGGDWGIAPDESHKRGGGYHCGEKDCQNIGKYHPPAAANVGGGTEDYSVRQRRDRGLGGNAASAEDIGDNWPNGGRDAWVRFNNLLVAQMRRGDPQLKALRAVNFSPDGVQRKRFDSLHPEAGVISSTDSVDIHTHLEYWRDTAGTDGRLLAFNRVEAIIQAAINNRPLTEEDDEEMGATLEGQIPPYSEYTDKVTGKKHAIGFTIAPGIIADGAANPRDGWLNLVGDGYGVKYAVRVLQTNGVKDQAGNVGWSAVFEADIVQFSSGERKNAALKKGTVAISFLRYAVDKDGKAVPVDTDSGLLANPHGLAWSIELGSVKH